MMQTPRTASSAIDVRGRPKQDGRVSLRCYVSSLCAQIDALEAQGGAERVTCRADTRKQQRRPRRAQRHFGVAHAPEDRHQQELKLASRTSVSRHCKRNNHHCLARTAHEWYGRLGEAVAHATVMPVNQCVASHTRHFEPVQTEVRAHQARAD